MKLALNYHASPESARPADGQKPGLSFEPGEVGEIGRERAPPRVKLSDSTSADEPSQSAFNPFGESNLTPSKSQQIIKQAINEKHAKAANAKVFREGRNQWNLDDFRRAESAFRRISQERSQAPGNAAYDPDFYQTQIAQRLRAIARQHGADVGFYKGDDTGPQGFYRAGTGMIWLRSNRSAPELVCSFEHEMTHHRMVGSLLRRCKKTWT